MQMQALMAEAQASAAKAAAEKEMVRSMLSESLIGVISQTLCKTKDGSGRVAAHEIMLGTAAIR